MFPNLRVSSYAKQPIDLICKYCFYYLHDLQISQTIYFENTKINRSTRTRTNKGVSSVSPNQVFLFCLHTQQLYSFKKITQFSIKKKKKMSNLAKLAMVDEISDLPDEILCHMFTFLPTKSISLLVFFQKDGLHSITRTLL